MQCFGMDHRTMSNDTLTESLQLTGTLTGTLTLTDEQVQVEQMLSSLLVQGFSFLDQSCPACTTPLIKSTSGEFGSICKATIPTKEKSVHPRYGIAYCVKCPAHIVANTTEYQLVQGSDASRDKFSIYFLSHSDTNDESDADGTKETGTLESTVATQSAETSSSNEYDESTMSNSYQLEEIEVVLATSDDADDDAEDEKKDNIVSDSNNNHFSPRDQGITSTNQDHGEATNVASPKPSVELTLNEHETLLQESRKGRFRNDPLIRVMELDEIELKDCGEEVSLLAIDENVNFTSGTNRPSVDIEPTKSHETAVDLAIQQSSSNVLDTKKVAQIDFVMPDFSVRREIAIKVLASKMVQGYSILGKQCDACLMPLMSSVTNELVPCFVCRSIRKSYFKALATQAVAIQCSNTESEMPVMVKDIDLNKLLPATYENNKSNESTTTTDTNILVQVDADEKVSIVDPARTANSVERDNVVTDGSYPQPETHLSNEVVEDNLDIDVQVVSTEILTNDKMNSSDAPKGGDNEPCIATTTGVVDTIHELINVKTSVDGVSEEVVESKPEINENTVDEKESTAEENELLLDYEMDQDANNSLEHQGKLTSFTASDPTIDLIKTEISSRTEIGWTLIDKTCSECSMPIMMDPLNNNEICVRCIIVARNTLEDQAINLTTSESLKVENWDVPVVAVDDPQHTTNVAVQKSESIDDIICKSSDIMQENATISELHNEHLDIETEQTVSNNNLTNYIERASEMDHTEKIHFSAAEPTKMLSENIAESESREIGVHPFGDSDGLNLSAHTLEEYVVLHDAEKWPTSAQDSEKSLVEEKKSIDIVTLQDGTQEEVAALHESENCSTCAQDFDVHNVVITELIDASTFQDGVHDEVTDLKNTEKWSKSPQITENDVVIVHDTTDTEKKFQEGSETVVTVNSVCPWIITNRSSSEKSAKPLDPPASNDLIVTDIFSRSNRRLGPPGGSRFRSEKSPDGFRRNDVRSCSPVRIASPEIQYTESVEDAGLVNRLNEEPKIYEIEEIVVDPIESKNESVETPQIIHVCNPEDLEDVKLLTQLPTVESTRNVVRLEVPKTLGYNDRDAILRLIEVATRPDAVDLKSETLPNYRGRRASSPGNSVAFMPHPSSSPSRATSSYASSTRSVSTRSQACTSINRYNPPSPERLSRAQMHANSEVNTKTGDVINCVTPFVPFSCDAKRSSSPGLSEASNLSRPPSEVSSVYTSGSSRARRNSGTNSVSSSKLGRSRATPETPRNRKPGLPSYVPGNPNYQKCKASRSYQHPFPSESTAFTLANTKSVVRESDKTNGSVKSLPVSKKSQMYDNQILDQTNVKLQSHSWRERRDEIALVDENDQDDRDGDLIDATKFDEMLRRIESAQSQIEYADDAISRYRMRDLIGSP